MLTMLSFILNPVHFPRILLVLEFSLGTPKTSLCFMSGTLSPSARSAAAANAVRADFGVSDGALSRSDFILKFVYENTVA